MTRTELINMLIKMHGFTSYLEIGMQKAENNFNKINAKYKVSVDPDPKAEAMHRCTSDQFFHFFLNPPPLLMSNTGLTSEYADKMRKEIISRPKRIVVPENPTIEVFDLHPTFDLIFIDGLHHADQVERDIINSMECLSPNGYIVLHDCNPKEYSQQIVPRETKIWYGNVWRAFVGFRLKYPDVVSCCLDHDCGLGIIKYTDLKIEPGFVTDMPWQEFDKNRKQLLGII